MMPTHLIRLFFENAVNFSAGGIYFVQVKREILSKEDFGSDVAIYLNYPFEEAKKIIPAYELLGTAEQKRVLRALEYEYGFKIRVEDALGKLIVLVGFYFDNFDVFFVGLTGFGPASIDFLTDVVRALLKKNPDKTVVFTEICPSLDLPISFNTIGDRYKD